MIMASNRNITKYVVIMAVFFLSVFLFLSCSGDGDNKVVTFTLLQTSDVHHHAAGYGPQSDYTPLDTSDNDSVKGGYARLAGLVKSIREEEATPSHSVLLVDSGDFLMGTTYDMVSSDPIVFRFFQSMGYDAVTLGNHEFDWGPGKLAELIDAGKTSGFNVPIIASNMVTNAADSRDDDIEDLVSDGTIVQNKIISIAGGANIGILGIMGKNANNVAPMAGPVTFNHQDAFLQEKVSALYAAGADLVILLSHTGVDSAGNGEDANIAEKVTGISIIASGHEHTATTLEFVKGPSNTVIFSPGSYGAYLSRLDVRFDANSHRIISHSFELIPVDDTVAGDADMDTLVNSYASEIDDAIHTAMGDSSIDANTSVSETSFDLEMAWLTETGFGNLVADAIRVAATDAVAGSVDDPTPFSVGIIANGVIRDNLYVGETGEITFADVYNALPLGISIYGDPNPGYPLMSAYLTAAELRDVCEVSASVAPLMGNDYYLNVSGIRYDYDPSADFGKRVKKVYMCDYTHAANDQYTSDVVTELNMADTTRYRVVVNHYVLSMMDVAALAGLSIIPKDKDGIALTTDDYANIRIDNDLGTAGIQELKEWMAFYYLLDTYYYPGEGILPALYSPAGDAMGRANDIP